MRPGEGSTPEGRSELRSFRLVAKNALAFMRKLFDRERGLVVVGTRPKVDGLFQRNTFFER